MSITHPDAQVRTGPAPAADQPELADVAVTPAQLLQRAAGARRRADAAERELLAVAVEWAHSHPETPAGWP